MTHIFHFVGRGVLILFLVIASVITLCVLVVGGAYAQVTGHFKGTGTLPADCAVVFGAAIYGNRAGPAIVRRVSTAATLYREKKIQHVILSGGRGEGNQKSEADVMKIEALNGGVAEKDITLESNSHSTWDNILYSKNLTSQCSSVVGISDGYHLARIELIARRQGWGELKTIPADSRPTVLSERQSVFRETVAYVYYLLRMDYWITSQDLQRKFIDKPEQAFVPGNLLQSIL